MTRSASLPLGEYKLDMSIEGLTGLTEFTEAEYAVYGRQFDGQTNYNAPRIDFVQRGWEVALGTVRGKVYKIALYFQSENKNAVIDVSSDVMQYCQQHLGKPSEQRETLTVWDAPDGNVLLQFGKVGTMYTINMFETSKSVRTFRAETPMRKTGIRIQKLISYLLTIGFGIALSAGVAFLVHLWFPRVALFVFLAISAYWLWTGWRYAVIRDELAGENSGLSRVIQNDLSARMNETVLALGAALESGEQERNEQRQTNPDKLSLSRSQANRTTPAAKILIFNECSAETLAFLLGERFGYSVQHVSTIDDLMTGIKQARFDLIILDLCHDRCRELSEEFQKLPNKVLFLTCGEDRHSFPRSTGAEHVMQTPLDPLAFVRKVRVLLGENVQ
jgi:hypothetical protein